MNIFLSEKKYIRGIFLVMIFLTTLLTRLIQFNFEKQFLTLYTSIAGLFFNHKYVYDSNFGFVEITGSYAVGKDCLGFNFTILLFLLLSISALISDKIMYMPNDEPIQDFTTKNTIPIFKRIRFPSFIFKWISISWISAFALGLIANTLRLLSSIYFVSLLHFQLIHAILGISIYLLILTAAYYFINPSYSKTL